MKEEYEKERKDKGIQTEKEKKSKEWKVKHPTHLGKPGIILDMKIVREETD